MPKNFASPRLKHITSSATSTIVIIDEDVSPTSATTILQFADLDTLKIWLEPPSQTTEKLPKRYKVAGCVTELRANLVAFALLNDTGDVYTWGDSRYPTCLGRDVGTSSAADIPGAVPELLGLRVTKLCGCGWYFAALTEAGDAYIWGGRPGAPSIEIGEEGDWEDRITRIFGPWESDIVDVAVGSGHFLVLDADGILWGAGRNDEGQLGAAAGEARSLAWEQWRKIRNYKCAQSEAEGGQGGNCRRGKLPSC